jgi:deoxyribonucleoside regulator
MEQDKLSKIVEAARLYYELDYSQQDIAKELGVSRPTVSRLLQQAKEQGIVRIEIIDPFENIEKLAHQLEQKFGLKKVLIASVSQDEDSIIKQHIGKLAADYLHEIIKDGDTIGVTWGTTLYQVALELRSKHVKDVNVVQLKGGVSHSEVNTYASEILTLFGQAYGTTPHYLPLPAIVDHAMVKQAVETDRHIRKVLEMGKRADIAVFTVGGTFSDALLLRLGYFSEEDLEVIYSKAAGDICSRFFDKQGNICSESLNSRTIGIELEQLKEKEKSILVAGGFRKVEAIYGALKGKYANVLITDHFTARALLEKETA